MQTKERLLEFKNNYGSYSFYVEGNIVIAQFKGNLNPELLNHFKAALLDTIATFKHQPWGYISHSPDVVAATPDAEKNMIDVSQTMGINNCIMSAFILTSPIAIRQLQRIMHSSGRDAYLQECLFDDLPSAKAFIKSQLTSAE